MENALNVHEDLNIPEGLKFLVEGYADYAKEVVTDRAIANIDGFKPSQRRILYTMKAIEKVKEFTKSQTIAGSVLKLHPHGDASVYETMVRMVNSSEYMNIPFVHGKGDFGKVFSTEPPAASRYTNVMLTGLAEELFEGMEGVTFLPSYDNKYQEPELLPVKFPNVITNPQSGIAVGVASNYPAFNFHEVNEATIELIETGDIKGVLAPDFTTKGFYVEDEKELRKIMETGRGRLKLRGKWFVDGKTIVIEEIPYYTTIKSITDKMKDIVGISDIRDETDRDGLRIAVECSSKRVVDSVLTEILRLTDLQMSMVTNIVVIINNKPRVIGIKELLKEWVNFRSGVIQTSLNKELEKLNTAIPQYEVFVSLLQDDDKRSAFTETLAKQGEVKARELLVKWFPTAEKFVFDWILDMRLKQFSGLGKNMAHLQGLRNRKSEIENDLTDVRRVIVRELKELNKKYSFPRKTVLTDEDYVFEKNEAVVVKAEAEPVVVVVDNKFIKKIRSNRGTEHLEGIRCMSDNVISFIDNQGRLLRVALDNIEFVGERDRGIYLPVYLEVEDDFEIMAYELIQDKKVGYVYSDGFVSVVDYGEWVDSKRNTRITANGVSTLSGLLVGEFDFSQNYLLLLTKSGRFGFTSVEFKHKHRTARTKLVNVRTDDEIVSVIPLSYTDIMNLVASPEKYMDKLSMLTNGDTFNTEYLSTLSQ